MSTKEKQPNWTYTCPICGFPGATEDQGDLGILVRHPGRDWPCRVTPGRTVADAILEAKR